MPAWVRPRIGTLVEVDAGVDLPDLLQELPVTAGSGMPAGYVDRENDMGIVMLRERSHGSQVAGLLKTKDSTTKRSFSRDRQFKQLEIDSP